MIDGKAGHDKLISKCPLVSRASRGRCLTALTDKSCQGDVCDIEQELNLFYLFIFSHAGRKNAGAGTCFILFALIQVSVLWINVAYKLRKHLLFHLLNFPLVFLSF